MRARLIQCRALLLGLALLILPVGCSLVPSPQTAQIYRLSPQVNDPPGRRIPHSELTISLPFASESLDTDRIALTQGQTRFDYYADSIWTDRVPVLLQTLMVGVFQGDGRFTEVNRDNGGLTQGYVLRTEIRQFEAQYPSQANGPPEVSVVLELRLSAGAEGRVLGHKLVSAEARASRNKLDSIVMAFDAATAETLAQTAAWTDQTISRDRGRRQ
jgi:cholesterol transport system auxiliary component